jgi:hypothetical protein
MWKTLLRPDVVYEVINMSNPGAANEKPCCEVRGGSIVWHSTTFKYPLPETLQDVPVDLSVPDGNYFTTDYGTKHKYIGYENLIGGTEAEVLLSGYDVKPIGDFNE